VGLQPATETDIAVAAEVTGSVTLSPVAETDTAVTLTAAIKVTLGASSESDVAIPVSTGNAIALQPATETDTAVVTGIGKTKVLQPATETDITVSIAIPVSTALGPAIETDSAVTIDLFCPDDFDYTKFDLSRRRLQRSILRNFGETVTFNIASGSLELKAALDWDVPEQPIGTQSYPRPRPYLVVRMSDVACDNIDAGQTVTMRGINATVVSEPMKDGEGWYRVYVRGNF
jgi:hypothetical protein